MSQNRYKKYDNLIDKINGLGLANKKKLVYLLDLLFFYIFSLVSSYISYIINNRAFVNIMKEWRSSFLLYVINDMNFIIIYVAAY